MIYKAMLLVLLGFTIYLLGQKFGLVVEGEAENFVGMIFQEGQ